MNVQLEPLYKFENVAQDENYVKGVRRQSAAAAESQKSETTEKKDK